MSAKKGILERLDEGIVVGDGGFEFALEKRGYVKAGPYTPDACVENPEAVRQLHREFLRAGSDVMQAFTFYASDDKLSNRGNTASERLTCEAVNAAACKLAREVADEGDALVAGCICQTPSYLSEAGKEAVQAQYKQQLDVFVKSGVDFVICEYFEHMEELEWAIEEACKTGLVVASSISVGPEGDMHGVSTSECAVRMAKAGSKIVGVNCYFDPTTHLNAMELMKEGLAKANLNVHMMVQPIGFHTPDVTKQGFVDLPEFPFALEPRILTRWDCHAYARRAYDIGIRYIGGCCGFEPYHIRAIAEELSKESGKLPPGHAQHAMWGEGLKMHTKPWVRARASKEFWQNLKPASGRPYCPAYSKCDAWGVTQGDELLKQRKDETDDQEMEKLKNFKKA